MSVSPIPKGYHSVTPYLFVIGAETAIRFYKRAFNAKEILVLEGPDGRIAHAEIKVGDSYIMLSNEYKEMGQVSPQSLGGSGVNMMIYVKNVDQVFRQAIASGASELRPVSDQFYGDRAGTILDPYGHTWTIATHKEDLSESEIKKRMKKALEGDEEQPKERNATHSMGD